MKIAVQLGLLPGESTRDRAKWARDHGVEGIELGVWGGGLPKMQREADEIGGIVPVCSVCGNADADGEASFHFLDPDPAKRRRSIEGSKAILRVLRPGRGCRADRAADLRRRAGAGPLAVGHAPGA